MQKGGFIISLDFELMWGVRDKRNLQSYGGVILNTHNVIDYLLDIFKTYNINATFSIVGFLFFKDKQELLENFPLQLPSYSDKNLNPYINGYVDRLKNNDKYHFASVIIDKIKSHENHEISTHTFSHYYCLEDGQTKNQFNSDIKKAIEVAKKKGVEIKSIVFPRNQFNDNYKSVLINNGILVYRGQENHWIYKEKKGKDDTMLRRGLRLVDTYINISGHNSFKIKKENGLINIPSSRLLRPYNKKLWFIEKLKLIRIKRSMTYAAKKNKLYHLWWHPHNFGNNLEKNIALLEEILNHYEKLNTKYNFKSVTMYQAANRLKQK